MSKNNEPTILKPENGYFCPSLKKMSLKKTASMLMDYDLLSIHKTAEAPLYRDTNKYPYPSYSLNV